MRNEQLWQLKLQRVLKVFKDASELAGRFDRDMQEVIDCQIYLLDEIQHNESSLMDTLISDFSYTLEQTLKTLFVTSDK